MLVNMVKSDSLNPAKAIFFFLFFLFYFFFFYYLALKHPYEFYSVFHREQELSGEENPACLVYISGTDGSFIAESLCVKILKRQSKHPMNSNILKQNQMKIKATTSWECGGY